MSQSIDMTDKPRHSISDDKKHVSVEEIPEDIKTGEIKSTDKAEQFLQEHGFSHAYLNEALQDELAMKKLRRRVDWTLMPLLCGTYMLQYIDKQALSYSAVFDLFETTGTTSYEYSWLASIFYFGYLFFEWPASYLAQHFPTGRVISIFVIAWGCILLITAACHNFMGLAITRFLLGCCESLVTPTFMMIVGQFYTRREQPARAGLFYCFNGVGSSVGGILFYCVGFSKGLAVWRAIYIICGGCTVCWGILLLLRLPNNIMSAKQFNHDEKARLIARSRQNQTGVYNPKIKWYQIKEALTDPQIWLLFWFTLLNETVNGGIANFGKLVVKGIANDDSLLTTLYGIPQGAFQVVFVFSGPFLASRFHNIRTYVMALYLCPTIIGLSMLWKMDYDAAGNGMLLAYYIVASYVASLVLALQLPATNVGGYTKRVTATAFVFLGYCAGNIIGPHAWLAEEAPTYSTGASVCLACAIGQVVLSFVLRALLTYRNKKRDGEAGEQRARTGELGEEAESDAIQDLTDFENPRFRYSM